MQRSNRYFKKKRYCNWSYQSGPNGAGKTTTIEVLSYYMKADSGEAYVAGYDVVKKDSDVKKHINSPDCAL